MSKGKNNTKSNTKSNTKTFHEEKSQNPSQVHVSLDNADTVIEGAPLIAPFAMSGILLRSRLGRLPKKARCPGLRAVPV